MSLYISYISLLFKLNTRLLKWHAHCSVLATDCVPPTALSGEQRPVCWVGHKAGFRRKIRGSEVILFEELCDMTYPALIRHSCPSPKSFRFTRSACQESGCLAGEPSLQLNPVTPIPAFQITRESTPLSLHLTWESHNPST